MSQVFIDGVEYIPVPQADGISVWGMYDSHLFHRHKGSTVDEVIADWKAHNSKPNMAYVGNDKTPRDIGTTELCPAIVLCGKKELRRIGQMVFWPPKEKDLAAWRKAMLDDPDVPRLLAATKETP